MRAFKKWLVSAPSRLLPIHAAVLLLLVFLGELLYQNLLTVSSIMSALSFLTRRKSLLHSLLLSACADFVSEWSAG